MNNFFGLLILASTLSLQFMNAQNNKKRLSSKYLQNYLNWYAYMDKIRNSKTMLKQWLVAMLLTDQAYHLFELFKQNAVLIRT